jgi:uncharacterized protein YkwD
MQNNGCSQRMSSQEMFRTSLIPGAPGLIIAVMLVILSARTNAQMVEERDRDRPPAEQPAAVPAETTPDLSAVEQLAVEQTNAFRQQKQLDAVTPNPNLNETAQYFADFMARTGKYGHTADDQRPSQRAENHGYDYCIVAENIAYQFRSTGFTARELASRFVSGWKQSPEHRENMLDPDVTEIGLAIARKPDSSAYFAVQMFGRPQSKSITFRISNESETEVSYTASRRGSERTFSLPPRMQRVHERCRPTQIAFDKPETGLTISDGAHYVVVRESGADGNLQVRKRD